MRVGIITFHWALNYGAVLQAYALQTCLQRLGHEVEIIDYRPSWAYDNQSRPFPRRISEAINIIDFHLRRYTFRKFVNKKLKVSKQRYYYGDSISGYDVVISGSDQVFNPDIIAHNGSIDDTYLLATVTPGTKKISYAASFGNSSLASEYRETYSRLLSQFDAIGIRENSGVEIVQSLGLNAELVPDPTLLLGDFSVLQSDTHPKGKHYIFSYIFQSCSQSKMVQQTISDLLKSPICSIQTLLFLIKGNKGLYNLSPSRWISAIEMSDYVITDSFHSTVFSLIAHRPFISLSLNAWGSDWNERIKSLLKAVNLKERLLEKPTKENIIKLFNTPIDWEDVEGKLYKLRNKGWTYLNAL